MATKEYLGEAKRGTDEKDVLVKKAPTS